MLPTVGVSLPKWAHISTGVDSIQSVTGEPYSCHVKFDPNALRLDWLRTWRDALRDAWMEKGDRARRDKLRSIINAYVALKVVRSFAVIKIEPESLARLGPFAKAIAERGDRVFAFDSATENVLREPPLEFADTPHDPFLQALHRALETATMMRLCHNRDCRHPFFVATKRTHKYCTQECAKPAKRAAKLRWWRKHGKKRRLKQSRQKKRQQHT
jgi:hypothetical protein